MVFKRPANSRDDRSARAPKRTPKGDEKAKKTTTPGYDKSASSGSEQSGSKLKRNHYGDEAAGGRRRSSAPPGKSYSGRAGSDDRPKRSPDSYRGGAESSGEKREYKPRKSSDDSSRSSFSGGEKKSFKPRSAPYSGRPTYDDKPKRSFGGESSGEKRPYTKKPPYSGRPSSDGRPKRSFDGESSGEKRDFKPGRSPYSSRSTSDDRPRRNSDSYRGDGESSGEKREFKPRSTPYSGRSGSDDKPKRSFGGDRKFGGASSDRGGFKKRGDDMPFRKSENSSYNKPKPERGPEERVMRGRKKAETEDKGLIRLNRYISNAGICSRRKADELIAAGVISVNGEVVSELGHKVDPFKDAVRYNGELLKREKMVYVLLNKPKDYITTTDDPQERRTVMHLVEKATRERIYPIGRLDRNTTGLLLMTNDGDLADKLSHPKNNITKLYQVELDKSLTQGDLNKIAFGVELEDGLIKPDSISYVAGGSKREVGIQIHSGKNRIVRRIFEHLGYDVVKLDRSVYANLTKKDLPRGRWRYLDEEEVIQLKHLI
jgi:23S rRNA pseudouridine2605 synthase